jgi:dTDP-4-amino-4,6-dideoxygalactose transaminase
LALLPAFTFVATASAVEQCGYRPYLADIDAHSWMLDPERLLDHPLLDNIGVVIPVAPFGRPVPQEAWRAFRQETGIPIVIDGAASFDTCARVPEKFISDIPVALSFHATKSFATGEGGAVVTTDVDCAACAMQSLNFGFYGTRDCRLASTNGKMSEYHAAVGLAELDGWVEKQSGLSTAIGCYRRLAEEVRVADGLHTSPDVSTSYVLFLSRTVAESVSVQKCFDRSGVDFRLWYGTGLHRQTYYSNLARDSLNTTEMLAPRLLGLPVAPDLRETSIRRVVTALTEGVALERLHPEA